MTQTTSQIGADQSGLAYRNADNAGKQAILNHHKGSSAPSYAEAGIIWLNDSGTPWTLNVYDGSDWITLGAVDATANTFNPYIGTAANRVLNYATDTGSANAYAVAPSPPVTAYATGQIVSLKPVNANTGASTLNVSSLGTKNIKLPDGTNPPANALVTTGSYALMYDGTSFVLLNPSVISAANITGTVGVSQGGTGAAATTAYAVLCGGTTSISALQPIAGIGTSGQVLTSNGAGALPTFQSISSAVKTVKKQIFASSGTYTPSTGMLYCVAEVLGGGGGGGGASSTASTVSAGGGAGGYSRVTLSAATVGASQTVTIGSGGTAGSTSGGTGGTGGASSLGSLAVGNGGVGGAGATAAGTVYAGGAGGTATSGDLNIQGQGGIYSISLGGASAMVVPGEGANTMFGAGGILSPQLGSSPTATAGVAATGYGAGGSGAIGASKAGGVGAGGLIYITEYCSQ